MQITAQLVRDLRERTGVGMMECKKALEATAGDINLAIEFMRKNGQAKADKKSSRIAAEGLIFLYVKENKKEAVLLEVNCETDFVARDDYFKRFAEALAHLAAHHQVSDVDNLMQLPLDGADTAEQVRQNLIAKIGENIQVRRLKYFAITGTILGSYLHAGRIGVLVDLQGGNLELAKDLAMHIAATNPLVVSRDQIPEEVLLKEKEIFTAQAETTGKSSSVIEKVVEGKINKFLDEVSLLEQPFVKDQNITIMQLLDKHKAKAQQFTRFALAESIK